MRALVVLFGVLSLPVLAWGQVPSPAVPPHGGPAATARKAGPGQAPSPAGSARVVAHASPVVRAKPGERAERGERAKPGAHPVAAVPAVVPAPVVEPEKPAEAQKGSNTGMALPRFAALRSEEVNFRSGPGVRYPIEWVYKRRDLPVQIEREFEVWRLVRDQEGVKGWVHQATLAPRRTAVVIGGEQVLRQSADEAAGSVARLKPGVIIRLRSCEATSAWCQAQTGDYRGWIKRGEVWGVFPGEAIQ
ncbi:MAG: hypothetical protein NVSMB18_35170 [Acetobacteraceae bacterium]